MRKLNVAVLVGGPSTEHDVSLSTGKMVVGGLDRDKYDSKLILVNRRGDWQISPEEIRKEFEVVFVAMHGEYGEDGGVQAVLERIGLPYTGSGVVASALGMNKILSSRLFRAYGINIPDFVVVNRHDDLERLHVPFDLPVIIKPADRGLRWELRWSAKSPGSFPLLIELLSSAVAR